jgi:hypothetical protein
VTVKHHHWLGSGFVANRAASASAGHWYLHKRFNR